SAQPFRHWFQGFVSSMFAYELVAEAAGKAFGERCADGEEPQPREPMISRAEERELEIGTRPGRTGTHPQNSQLDAVSASRVGCVAHDSLFRLPAALTDDITTSASA